MTELLQLPAARAVAAGVALVLLALLWLFARERRRRRRAEGAARAAQAQVEAISGTMREGVIAYDLDLRLVYVNPAFERLTGYAADEIYDQEFLQYVHPDDRAALLAEWDRLASGGVLRNQEYRLLTRSGQVRWSSSAWEPLRDASGQQIGYLGTEFDITERKLAEAEMLRDTELFQAVLEVQQAVAAAGLDSRMVMHVIAERSQRLTGASGAVIETIEGEDLVPQVHIGTKAPRLKLATSLSGFCFQTGELQRSDDVWTDSRVAHSAYRLLGIRSMLAVPLKEDQRTLGVLKVVSPQPHAFSDRDAKALRLLGGLVGAALGHAAAFEARQTRLEERTSALQESEQRFKQVVDVAQEGIWLADTGGAITYVNQRMAELLGYQNGALIGRPVQELLDPESRAAAARMLEGKGQGPPGEPRDLRFRRRDGSELWALVSASPIVGRDGAPVGTVGMLTDITERKRDEHRLREELTRRNAELERRLAETGAALRGATAEVETLLYAMSHDLRAPLRHIGGFAQLLQEDCEATLDPAAKHCAGRIQAGIARLASLLDDLLSLARIGRQDLARRPVDLTAAAHEVVEQVRCQAGDRPVDWQIEPLPTVEADPGLVKLALTQLLSNALKFTRPRAPAVIRVRPVERDGQAGVAVEDNGVGFKMAYAGKLFGVFQRLHRAEEFEGNGAGLAMVHRIAHKHGGQVWADAAEDRGATFCLTFGSPARAP